MDDPTKIAWRFFDIARTESASSDALQSVALPLALLTALRVGAAKVALPFFRGQQRSQSIPWDALIEPERLHRADPRELAERACVSIGLPREYARDLTTIQNGRLLRELAAWVGSVPLTTSLDFQRLESALGEVVWLATERNRSGGEYATPPSLARLMVSLAKVRPGQRVYDPCCGVGELLASAARAQALAGGDAHSDDYAPLQHGVERFAPLAFIAQVRVLLAGGLPSIVSGDALLDVTTRRHPEDGYDIVLVHPPWGVRLEHPGSVDSPNRPKSAEGMFVQHGLDSLRPNGTAVFAVPAGMLFRDGAEKQIRRMLLENYGLSIVTVVPPQRPRGSSIPTAVIVTRRQLRRSKVLFLEVKAGLGAEEAVTRIASAAEVGNLENDSNCFANDVSISAGAASPEEIVANDYSLDASRYTNPALPDALAELSRRVDMRPLASVARVVGGVALQRAAMTNKEAEGRPIIRVSDVDPKGPLLLGARFLATKTAINVREDQSLRAGDILLTIDGTIGKTHAVTTMFVNGRERALDTEPKAVIAKGVVAVRVESSDVDPRFLHAVLRSDALRDRLRRSSRGIGIPHVALAQLRSLLVPVPPFAVQGRVVRRLAEQGGDAIEALGLVLSDQDGDQLADLFREHPAFIRLAGEGEPEKQELERLALEALETLRRLRNQLAHPEQSKLRIALEFHPWLLRVGALPIGAMRPSLGGDARYEALAASAELLDAAVAALKPATGLMARQAARLTSRLAEWARVEQQRLADDFVLEARQVPPAGGVEQSTIEIEIFLRGQAALRSVKVLAPAGWELGVATSQARLPLGTSETISNTLATNRPIRIQLHRASDEKYARVEALRIPWTATRLDGSVAASEFFCDIAPAQRSLFEPRAELGASPYVTGDVVEDKSMFFGRSGVLADIRTHIGGGTKVILLEGNRRTGKTSILRRVQSPDFGLLGEWVTVECSFQGAVGDEKKDGVPTKDLFRLIVRDIGLSCSKAGIAIPLPGMSTTTSPIEFKFAFVRALNPFFEGLDPYEALQLYIDLVSERIAPKRLLLMFDEFDKLQVGIDNGVTSPQVPENIRNLLQTRSTVAAILTGSRRLKRLREEYWSALFGFGHRIGIDPLQVNEVRALIQRPVQDRLIYSSAAVDLIVRLTASQPFLVQSLCARIFELAKRDQQRRIDRELVAQTAQRMVRDNEHFQALWSYAETERRRFLLCLCREFEGGETRVSADFLAQRLEKAGIAVSVDAVDDDLKMLLELEIVQLTNIDTGPQYGLAVPLMKMWMQEAVDSEAQRRRAIREDQERTGR